MIKYPTVLVLGAGSSMPYGFPSGIKLREMICNLYTEDILISNFGNDFTRKFIDAFRDSNVSSIDSFLARRSEFVDIGKIAIATIICRLEDPIAFKNPVDDHWYMWLWNKMLEEVHTIEELKENKLKIITFNYDRSLEYFLTVSIMNTFDVPFQDALDALTNIEIIHFYGQLGKLRDDSYSSDKSRIYAQTYSEIAVTNAAKDIKVMPEARNPENIYPVIEKWFTGARNIVFLGFGFDRLNMERLGLEKALMNRYGNTSPFGLSVIASALDLTRSEIDLAGQLASGEHKDAVWQPFKGKSRETLREFAGVLN